MVATVACEQQTFQAALPLLSDKRSTDALIIIVSSKNKQEENKRGVKKFNATT